MNSLIPIIGIWWANSSVDGKGAGKLRGSIVQLACSENDVVSSHSCSNIRNELTLRLVALNIGRNVDSISSIAAGWKKRLAFSVTYPIYQEV